GPLLARIDAALRDLQSSASAKATTYPGGLTQREVEVLRLVAQGLSNQDIGEELHIGAPTVRTHVSNIMSKLYLANRVQAVLYALREGLSSLDAEPGGDGYDG
ncbi:MAG: response regulator transcription factor, partial [Anaerolineae bacterium]|nr:response regulator transcription factor [Anaerolineae bacterium]